MKNLKITVLSLALIFATTAFAGVEKVVIKTSAQCDMCKERLEKSIGKLEGVKKVLLNVDTKELSVKFDNEVVSKDEIVKAINGTGYWADNSMPDREAYAKLDDCCKPKAKSCCASKGSAGGCSKDAANSKECSKDGAKKDCSKDGAKKECAH